MNLPQTIISAFNAHVAGFSVALKSISLEGVDFDDLIITLEAN